MLAAREAPGRNTTLTTKRRKAKGPESRIRPITIPAIAGLGYYLREAYRSFAREFDSRLAAYRVTHSQWVVLWFLSQAGTLTPLELAKKAGVQKASATFVIASLKRRKLIASVQSETDRRKINVFLTEAGAELMKSLIDCAAATNTIPLSRFSRAQIGQLITMLQGVVEALEQSTPKQ